MSTRIPVHPSAPPELSSRGDMDSQAPEAAEPMPDTAQLDANQADTDQRDADQRDANRPDADQRDADQRDANRPDADPAGDSATLDSLPGEPPVKVCRWCSVQNRTDGAFCPNCGASYAGRRKLSKRAKIIVLAVAAALILGAVGTGIGLNVQHQNEVAAQAAAAEAAAQQKADAEKTAADKAATEEAAQEAADDAKRTLRALVVDGLEDSILKDAKKRVTDGVLTGPILSASCTPMGGGSTSDLTELTGSYECIAVNEKRKDGTASGYRFSATTNWDDGSYS